MKTRLTLAVLVAFLALCSCDSLTPEPRPDCHMVLLYSASYKNGLSPTASKCLQSLRCEYLPDLSDRSKVFLTYYHLDTTSATLSRLYKTDNGEFKEERLITYPVTTNSLEPGTVSQILTDAGKLFPSTRNDLVISSHASGFAPVNTDNLAGMTETGLITKNGFKALGPEDVTGIEITDFAKAIRSIHFDNIVFDCCFMSGIEVAYELKDGCDYIIASPTEVMAEGMMQPVFLDILFNADAEKIPQELCKAFMDVARTNPAYYKSGTVAAIDCSDLNGMAEVCKDIFSTCRRKIDTLDISSIQKYYRTRNQDWFYDLDDFVYNLLSERDSLVFPELYSTFTEALGHAVIYKDATDDFLGLKIDRYSGISSYIPNKNYSKINDSYKTLAWNKATGLVY